MSSLDQLKYNLIEPRHWQFFKAPQRIPTCISVMEPMLARTLKLFSMCKVLATLFICSTHVLSNYLLSSYCGPSLKLLSNHMASSESNICFLPLPHNCFSVNHFSFLLCHQSSHFCIIFLPFPNQAYFLWDCSGILSVSQGLFVKSNIC